VKLSLAVAAILNRGLKCQTQFWKGATQGSFQQSLVEIGSARWPPQCSCVVIESSFDPGERLQAPGSLWFIYIIFIYIGSKLFFLTSIIFGLDCFKRGSAKRAWELSTGQNFIQRIAIQSLSLLLINQF
jgi:hypothetical protein